MRSLNQQFDECLADIYNRDKQQRLILAKLLSDYAHKPDLIDFVMTKMLTDYQMGDDAKGFFCHCADELFKENLKAAIKAGGKRPESIKALHPLFGESWWTT